MTSAKSLKNGGASVRLDSKSGDSDTLYLSGTLDKDGVGPIWDETTRLLETVSAPRLVIDVSNVEKFDTVGAGLIAEIRARHAKTGADCELQGLSSEFQALLSMFDTYKLAEDEGDRRAGDNFFEQTGMAAAAAVRHLTVLIEFLGECAMSLLMVMRHPSRLRWQDVLLIAEKAGVNGFPIIVMVGFLMGLIMAFQSAIPLKRFGAELYVANLLAISMVRELGPLVTSILLAGRTGSAFAAEIGTMKVNEEIDALTTMGLDPIRFLAAPRILATMGIMPILTTFFTVFALAGGAVVILSFGYPLVTYLNKVHASITLLDICGGMFKALVFSLIVAGIGCERGLTTQTGASAVGDSTTSAVVSALILITLTDGMFAVAFYFLGI